MIISFLTNTIKTSSILCTLTPIRNISSSIKTKVIIIIIRALRKRRSEKRQFEKKDDKMFTLHNLRLMLHHIDRFLLKY